MIFPVLLKFIYVEVIKRRDVNVHYLCTAHSNTAYRKILKIVQRQLKFCADFQKDRPMATRVTRKATYNQETKIKSVQKNY
jgi:hypothetical protein